MDLCDGIGFRGTGASLAGALILAVPDHAVGDPIAMIPSLVDRSHYAALEECVYLNQASLGLIGGSAVSSMHAFLDDVGRHGNLRMSDIEEVAYVDSLRDRAARLLHVEPDRIAILACASELLGQMPMLVQPDAASNVLVVDSDFPAVTRPWLLYAATHDIQVRFVEDEAGVDLTSALIESIDERTAVVAVSSVQYGTGTAVDVRRLRHALTEAGGLLIVDATQAAGAVRVDAEAWQADVVVTSGYKWLGGHGGVALAAISPELLQQSPPLPGWMSAPDPFGFDATQVQFAHDARRYTQSTMSYVSIAGLIAALEDVLAVGEVAIEEHAQQLANTLVESVQRHGWQPFRGVSDPTRSSHIVSLRHPAVDAQIATDALRRRGIVCGTRGGGVRVSIAAYNESGDIDCLVEGLAEIAARAMS
jgi:selenocysteine lyase/cysteine desulfurase